MKSGELIAGKYRLDARLGIGGMGEVWKATHETTGREYALKFMHAHAATSASARQRFAKEARVSAKINHPNVIDIFDAGALDDGVLFLAMELLEGLSLGDALHARPQLSVQDLLTVMYDTSRALAAAHAVGVVHRDVKPANIFLHKDRATGFASAKILDFGISKFGGNDDENNTKTGAILGSPRYMSPEQTRSAASVDTRADLWAAGVILFEGLTGTWPHEGDSFSSLVVAICTMPPTSIDLMVPELPEALRAIVRDCLKPVGQRLQTAGELAERLAAVLRDPLLAQVPLPRPLHGPSESAKATTGVRVRPPTLTITAAPESLRTTQERARALPAATPPPSRRYATPASAEETDESSSEPTQVRAVPAHISAIPELAALRAEPPAAFVKTAPVTGLSQSTPGQASPFAGLSQSTPGQQSPFARLSQSTPGQASPFAPLSQSTPGQASPFAPLSQSTPGQASPFAPLSQSTPGQASPFAPLSQSTPGQASPFAPLSQSTPGQQSPIAGLSQSTPGQQSPIAGLSQSTPGQASPFAAPSQYKPHLKTLPLQDQSALQAELARSGLVAPVEAPPVRPHLATAVLDPAALPDLLVGTVSRISFDARPSSAPPETPPPVPSQPALPAPVAAPPLAVAPRPGPGPAKSLRLMLAALSVLFAGIVVALVSVVRSVPSGDRASAGRSSAAPSATEPTPAALPTVTAAEPATVTPIATIAPTATVAPAPTATAAPTAAPAPERGRPSPPPPRGRPGKAPGSRIKQLGSGLD